ncbi:MAG: protein-ADP-ribose hydrolase [Atopobium sp.]|uniref:protein-ADP-ribose hydrolase n=1 Tax=Atopobium sp. TaxID=1872650 RepID=UPI002A764A80|nr:protein-ADP-ribose hydrolase [Atopobium sp.]MDY2788571.1 protein-ADP-ribose hydrolase [Atopobium sp.]
MEQQHKIELLQALIQGLCAERDFEVPNNVPRTKNADELWSIFRALVNTRPPIVASNAWLHMQDELLAGLISEAGITTVEQTNQSTMDSRMRLWKGDITTLAIDAIVNAANSQMLGCWRVGHHCIDNAIHTFAGVQLRMECAKIMASQGHEELTGLAKITKAYNLPAKHVIHTVGPIANGHPTNLHRMQLASCYKNCLDLALKNNLSSLAFCCISTGVFGFPQKEAAEIAVTTIRDWLNQTHSQITIVCNVFSHTDWETYSELLDI